MIKDFPVLMPPVEHARRFTALGHHSLNAARTLMFENRSLAALCDLLLPKLVTGEIDVSHLDLDAIVA